jgi:hypothetical protein
MWTKRKSEHPKYQFLANIAVGQHAEEQQQMKEDAENTSKPNPERKL